MCMRIQVPEEARHTRFLRAFVNFPAWAPGLLFEQSILSFYICFFFQVWPIRDIVVCVREPALIIY